MPAERSGEQLRAARARRLLAEISRPVERVFASVELLRDEMLSIAAAVGGARRQLRRRDLEGLRSPAALLLARHPGFVAGAGVVMAPGVLADVALWIEWWWPGSGPAPERLEVDLDPSSAEFYDYTTTEWFREPRRTGARHIAGPYVDYICTHQYTFTLAEPLVHQGRFLGVAGADILASQVEAMAGRCLATLPCTAVLASAGGRIISSNTTELMPGAVLERECAGVAMRIVRGAADGPPDAALPWVLHTGD